MKLIDKLLVLAALIVALGGLGLLLTEGFFTEGADLPTRQMATELQNVFGTISADSYFTAVASNATGNILEANATAFASGTGKIQIAIHYDSGTGATAGTITVYSKVLLTDTVYTAIPAAAYSLIIGTTSRVTPVFHLGAPGYYKLVVSGFAGTMTYDLLTRDCHR